MAEQDTFRTYTGNGVTRDFAIPFTYELPSEVEVTLNDAVTTDWYYVSPSVLRTNFTPAVGAVLTVGRVTNIDSPAVLWKNGSGTTGSQLNAMVRQLINAMQEARDTAARGLFRLASGVYDFANARGVRLADPIGDTDVVNKRYADSVIPAMVATATNQAGIAVSKAQEATNRAADAAASVLTANGWNDKAQAWAEQAPDLPVAPGMFSAKHWATKARDIVNVIAAGIPFTPAGNIAATNVQMAIQELDTEKATTQSVALKADASAVIPKSNGGALLDEVAAPATPAANKVIIYAKADGKIYKKDDTGAEKSVGGGPSLGEDSVIRTNSKTIDTNISFTGNENGMTAGPVTISNGITVDIPNGSTWSIV